MLVESKVTALSAVERKPQSQTLGDSHDQSLHDYLDEIDVRAYVIGEAHLIVKP